ncbi:hypothetical protein E6H31_04895 [Candidatus Bathyarchaeota archaeon]|nr:MAG: hypothetical protein E6H31_04895 [Candidatus Bathyarchaeota archaeon]
MRHSTLKLLVLSSGLYVLFLVFLRSLLPEPLAPSITILALPLLILVLILVSDLSYRATTPLKTPARTRVQRFQARDVQYLSRQVEVASIGSQAYFESILLSRLIDIFAEKVSLETGIEKEKVKQELADAVKGPALVRDGLLYRLLYGSTSFRGATRVKMLREAVDGIEAWKA